MDYTAGAPIESVFMETLRDLCIKSGSGFTYMSSKEYRKSVDIPDTAACQAFEALPATLFASPKTMYPHHTLKNAPVWAKGIRLIAALQVIVDASCGQGIHQKSTKLQFAKWSSHQGMNITEEDQDIVVLPIRALLCRW